MNTDLIIWYILIGLLLTVIGAIKPLLKKVYLTSSTIYLIVGLLIGPLLFNLLGIRLTEHYTFLEHITETAVIVSLFSAGMKLRHPLTDKKWIVPVLLATLTMIVCISLVTTMGVLLVGLPLGFAVLCGAVLAPTDPVLAAEIQLDHPDEKDSLRQSLTAEAGLNDASAFPFVLLGVGLVSSNLHSLGTYFSTWIFVDVLWKIFGAAITAYFIGHLLGKFIIKIRSNIRVGIGTDEILVLGHIALLYGVALLIDTYAFLAVFLGAVLLRRLELSQNQDKTAKEVIRSAKKAQSKNDTNLSKDHTAALLARNSMIIADTAEALVEILLVIIIGILLSTAFPTNPVVWISAVIIIFAIRPLVVFSTVFSSQLTLDQKVLTSWFGVKGIGSIYYLTHAFGLGVLDFNATHSSTVAEICLATITLSILLHGLSVTPLMRWYRK